LHGWNKTSQPSLAIVSAAQGRGRVDMNGLIGKETKGFCYNTIRNSSLGEAKDKTFAYRLPINSASFAQFLIMCVWILCMQERWMSWNVECNCSDCPHTFKWYITCIYPFCNQQQKDISNEGMCDKLLCSIGVFVFLLFFFSFYFLIQNFLLPSFLIFGCGELQLCAIVFPFNVLNRFTNLRTRKSSIQIWVVPGTWDNPPSKLSWMS